MTEKMPEEIYAGYFPYLENSKDWVKSRDLAKLLEDHQDSFVGNYYVRKDTVPPQAVLEGCWAALDNAILSIEAFSVQCRLSSEQKEQAEEDMDQCGKAISALRLYINQLQKEE